MNRSIASSILSNLLDAQVSFATDTNKNSLAITACSNRDQKVIDNCAVVFDQIYKKNGRDFDTKLDVFNEMLSAHGTSSVVYVKTLTGKQIRIPFKSSFLVEELKEMIFQAERIPVRQQRLIFKSKPLENKKTLGYYEILQESTFHLHVKQCHGGDSFSIKTFDGQRLSFCFQTQTQVIDIKTHIEEEISVPVERQILIFESRELTNDQQTIGEIGIGALSSNESKKTVYMILKERVGQHIILSPDILDARYDYDFTNISDAGKTFERGGREYKRPCGWKRIALKVKDKYGNNVWLGMKNSSGEWPVAYHGTNFDRIHGICFEGFDMNKWKRELYGKAHYTTPDIDIAEEYACHVYVGGEMIKFVLQCRVNPEKMLVRKDGKYWLLPSDDDLRPYGICFKVVK